MKVVVVGAGVIGLTSAIVLRRRGHDVEIWSRDASEDTVSAVAGAIWYPFLAEPRARVLAWSKVTHRHLTSFAADAASGVSLCAVTEHVAAAQPDPWWAAAAGPITRIEADQLPAGWAAAIETIVPVCDVPRHLPWLGRQAARAGVRILRRTVQTLDEALQTHDAVVNCTGLSAASLCDDTSLVPVRGQVVVAARAGVDRAWIDDSTAQPFYVIPRGDEVVLGGTAQFGDARLEADPADTASILRGIGTRVPELANVAVRSVRVGLRPYRPTVRLEMERRQDGRRLVHNYGHGGSGYTLAWGCAEEVAQRIAD